MYTYLNNNLIKETNKSSYTISLSKLIKEVDRSINEATDNQDKTCLKWITDGQM